MEKGFSGVCHPGVLVNVLMSWLLNHRTIFGVPLFMSFECFFLFWICRVYCKTHNLEEGIGLLFLFPLFRVVCPSLFSPLHHGVKLMNLSRASTKQIKTHYTSFIPCDVHLLDDYMDYD
jgi:hypothetical protein